MRFLHLADLHLGRVLNNYNLLEDQRYTLQALTDTVRTEKVDAVLIAGDIYQKASPQAEAMTLFSDFLLRLNEMGVKVFAISGNHDSAERVSYLSSFMAREDVYLTDAFNGRLKTVTLEDTYGPLHIHMLPFIRPANVRPFTDRKIGDYTDAVRAVIENSDIDPSERNLILAHQYVAGAVLSGTEELVVGGLDVVDGSVFDPFDYVALGHLHTPQRVGRDTVRYAGSLLKYSFSEIGHKKTAVLIDMKEKGNVTYQLVPVPFRRDMREVRETLREVLSEPYSEDLIRVILTDENVPPDARVTVTTVFPYMLSFGVSNSKTTEETGVDAGEIETNKTVEELFSDFYAMQNNGVLPTEEHLTVLRSILEELEGTER